MTETTRPPIVTVLGHVDHGKTTLLDAIRKSNIAGREAGGITQNIGASLISTKEGKKITFIDTPGHAAFSAMRGRGANVADIALLVVGADDGVKPQTKEAYSLIKTANIPFIVVATKMDLPSASTETVYSQLEKEGVLFEGRGGDVPLVAVSAKKNEGIEKLLEIISLLAEIHGVKGDPKNVLEAVIIETSKGKAGASASVVVRNGSLVVGKEVYAQEISCRVKALFDTSGKSVKEVYPGEAAAILGFATTPDVGTKISDSPQNTVTEIKVKEKRGKLGEEEIAVFLKADNAGSLEALVYSMPEKAVIVGSSVGELTSSDVLSAKNSSAIVLVFEAKIPSDVAKLAETEGVIVERFKIIYELIQRLEEIINKGLKVILGRAEVLASFPYENKKIAGCKVLEGRIKKGDLLTLVRGEKEIGSAKIISMKKQKQEINESKAGEEFGVLLSPQLDFAIGDVLLSAANG